MSTMKLIFGIAGVVLANLLCCVKPTQVFHVEVTYTNGDKDTMTVKAVYLEIGYATKTLYAISGSGMSNTEVIATGVRKIKYLKP